MCDKSLKRHSFGTLNAKLIQTKLRTILMLAFSVFQKPTWQLANTALQRASKAAVFCLMTAAACIAWQTPSVAQTGADVAALQNKYQEELDKWMLQAYEGDRDAQFKVGVLFTNDQFSSADFEQAVYWYKQAARQGHSLAQYNLGHQYLTGVGVKRSEMEAMMWWLKAAQQDHPLAQFNVGRGYYLGIGLAEDHSQSQYWFKRAAQNQEPKSIEILEQLGWAKPGEYVKPKGAQPPIEVSAASNTVANQTAADKPRDRKSVV